MQKTFTDFSLEIVITVFPHIRPTGIIISHRLQMRLLLENTTFSLHKSIRNARIIRLVHIF